MSAQAPTCRGPQSRASEPALRGVRVLDLTSVIMGPVCTQILADHGAEVVKVEPPEGDVMRHAGAKREAGMGSLFVHANRGKRSVALDLKRPDDRALLLDRLPGFDVLVHNMRADAAARLGLDYDTVAERHPSVVYAELSGYGAEGRYAGRPAFDDIIQAQTGIADLLGTVSADGPRYLPVLIADRITGISAAQQVLAALYRRRCTGAGAYLNVAMFETMAAFVLSDHLGGRTFEPQAGPLGYSRLLTPHRRPFRTSDGYVAAIVYNDKHWRAFFDLVGRPEVFVTDARFSSAAGRAEHYDEIYAYIADIFVGADTAHWLRVLDAADIPCAPVNDIAALVDDQHLADVDFFRLRGDGRGGRLRLMEPPGVDLECPIPPTCGQHDRAALDGGAREAPVPRP